MIVDIVVGVIVLASALISFMRGFIREVLTILGVVGGIVAAIVFGPQFAPVMRGWFGITDEKTTQKLFDVIPIVMAADVAAYASIFIIVVIILSIISHLMSGAARAVGLGPVDRTLGVAFGIARAVVVLALIYIPVSSFLSKDQKNDYLGDSRTVYYIEKVADKMDSYLPEGEKLADKTEKAKDEAQDEIRKKLQEQNILQGDKKEEVPVMDGHEAQTPDDKGGYQDEQRQKLESLFKEDADPASKEGTPPAGNQ